MTSLTILVYTTVFRLLKWSEQTVREHWETDMDSIENMLSSNSPDLIELGLKQLADSGSGTAQDLATEMGWAGDITDEDTFYELDTQTQYPLLNQYLLLMLIEEGVEWALSYFGDEEFQEVDWSGLGLNKLPLRFFDLLSTLNGNYIELYLSDNALTELPSWIDQLPMRILFHLERNPLQTLSTGIKAQR